MQPLSNADFLALWERGRQLHSLDRGLLAIHAACPESEGESAADWPLGRYNRVLMELRNACFGSALQAWSSCSRCGEKVELRMDCRVLPRQAEGGTGNSPETVEVKGETFRLPTTRDLARLATETGGETDPAAAALALVEACRVPQRRVPQKNDLEQVWSEEEVEEISEKLASADPLAEILLSFECPACSSSTIESLDLAVFVWSEIEARVRRLLFEVHTLASAYGWTEDEVLSLSDARRRLYLEMVRS